MSAFGEKNGAWFKRTNLQRLRLADVKPRDQSLPTPRLQQVEIRAIYEQILILKEYFDQVSEILFKAGMQNKE